MILYIDTTDFNKVMFSLGGEKNITRYYKIDSHRSHETLQKLDEFLKSAKVKLLAIKKIVANKGPGSYTGVRVGVTHAQALGFALNVPVKFLAKNEFDMLP
jgi:tRNA threonylcarbamoyladenosine biosynthesis protein TsaB